MLTMVSKMVALDNNCTGTTVWVDKPTRDKLRIISIVLQRSVAAQVRFMVDREFDRLQNEGYIGPNVLAELREEVEE